MLSASIVSHVVSHWPVTADAHIWSHLSRCGICGGQIGTWTDCSHSIRFPPLSVSFHQMLHTCSSLASAISYLYFLLSPVKILFTVAHLQRECPSFSSSVFYSTHKQSIPHPVSLSSYKPVCNAALETALFNYLIHILPNEDRGSTVVKVLCYKSESRWFDPSWCQWILN